MLDHSLLHPTMTQQDLKDGCEIARRYEVASVCIKPYAVKDAAEWLKGSDVFVGTVIGFPHGNSTIDIKCAETKKACEDGAVEIDMVLNVGKALEGDWDYLKDEIGSVLAVVHEHNAILKVIFENDFIVRDEIKVKLCQLCSEIGVDYVKTSTGYGMVKGSDGKFSTKGATQHDVKLMLASVSGDVKVKAAGGVRTLDDVLVMRELGVTRIGASASVAMLEEAYDRFGGKRPEAPDVKEDVSGY